MTAPEAHRIATIRQQCEASEAMREARAMIALQAASGRFEYTMNKELTEADRLLLLMDGFDITYDEKLTISWTRLTAPDAVGESKLSA